MKFSSVEIAHIVRAWAAITLAFAILNTRQGFFSFNPFTQAFLTAFAVAAVTVGTGFVLHELAHKYFAQKYGCRSEFRAFDNFLIAAIAMSFFGFIIAAPGAVFIQGNPNLARHGRIAAAGPATNLVLGALFALLLFVQHDIVQMVAVSGLYINALLGLFNLIPFGIFDGATIYRWDKKVWGAMLIGAFALLMFAALP